MLAPAAGKVMAGAGFPAFVHFMMHWLQGIVAASKTAVSFDTAAVRATDCQR